MACSIRRTIWNLLHPSTSLTIQSELLILGGIDISSPLHWDKQFGMFKKVQQVLS